MKTISQVSYNVNLAYSRFPVGCPIGISIGARMRTLSSILGRQQEKGQGKMEPKGGYRSCSSASASARSSYSVEVPPTSSMFKRAGGKGEKANSITLPDAISQISTTISAIASKAPPPPMAPPTTAACSPIDMRSKCYKQLSEIRVVGVLSEEEYASEKCAVMDALKKL